MKEVIHNPSEYNIAEYIWIDARNKLRSKSKTLYLNSTIIKIDSLPNWNFDGSSTEQAIGNNSEVILKPVSIFKDPFRPTNGILVLCECYDILMKPVKSNNRYNAKRIFDVVETYKPWFGLEQEYTLYNNKTKRPLGWAINENPEAQGKYYCGIGADRVFGREIVEEHYQLCLNIGIKISGINAEVMPGQWEFQVGPVEGIDACDQLWMARYVMERLTERYDFTMSIDPKPMPGDWNGSGCHTNYSTKEMREEGGLDIIYQAIEKLEKKHMEHIKVYGNNEQRLTGTHETSRIDEFSSGVADRTASIRIPLFTQQNKKGYLEDRRPASDIDPYLVLSKIVETTILN